MRVIWKYSENARKHVENVYKFCVHLKQSGLKMSLERAWDRTAALTRESRATAQRIPSKKIELPSPLIDQAQTVIKVTLDEKEDASNTRKLSKGLDTQATIMSCYTSTSIV